MIDYLIIYAITALILLSREYFFMQERKMWASERQKLLDRIQARDLREFKQLEKPKEDREEKEETQSYEWL